MLKLLPELAFPLTSVQVNTLMDNVVQMNLLEGGLNPNYQRALGLHFDIHDLLAKTRGTVDYRGRDGHQRLFQHAMTLVGPGTPIITRHGDLKAAHLAIDFNDTQKKLEAAGLGQLSSDVQSLLAEVMDLTPISPREDDSMSLFMRYMLKK